MGAVEKVPSWYTFTADDWYGFTEDQWYGFPPYWFMPFYVGMMHELFITMTETIRGPHIKEPK